MVNQGLTPGMQDGEEANFGSQVFRVSADRAQGVGGGSEEQVVNECLILIRDGGDFLRESEDDVKVGTRQELGLSVFNPLRACERLTLRAVSIATAVITDALMPARITALDVATERSGAACGHGLHDAPLRTRQRRLVLRTIGITVPADDVRQLDLGSLHGDRGSEVLRPLGRFWRQGPGQQIQRAAGRADLGDRQTQVARCG